MAAKWRLLILSNEHFQSYSLHLCISNFSHQKNIEHQFLIDYYHKLQHVVQIVLDIMMVVIHEKVEYVQDLTSTAF